jgi:hypothetical protein
MHNLSVYGLLRIYPIKRRDRDAASRDGGRIGASSAIADGMKFRPVVELTASGVAVMRGTQRFPWGWRIWLDHARRLDADAAEGDGCGRSASWMVRRRGDLRSCGR